MSIGQCVSLSSHSPPLCLSVSLSLSPPLSHYGKGEGVCATALMWKSEDSFQDSALFSPWFLDRVSCFYHVCHRGFIVESEWPIGCLLSQCLAGRYSIFTVVPGTPASLLGELRPVWSLFLHESFISSGVCVLCFHWVHHA